jgi:hypothetical protein
MFLQEPSEHFKDELDLNCRCGHCKTLFVVKDGFAFEGWLQRPNGVIQWAATVACSETCRLLLVYPEGQA